MIHVVVAIGKDWGGGYVHGVMKRYSWSIKEKQRQDDENISIAIIKQDLACCVCICLLICIFAHVQKWLHSHQTTTHARRFTTSGKWDWR